MVVYSSSKCYLKNLVSGIIHKVLLLFNWYCTMNSAICCPLLVYISDPHLLEPERGHQSDGGVSVNCGVVPEGLHPSEHPEALALFHECDNHPSVTTHRLKGIVMPSWSAFLLGRCHRSLVFDRILGP